MSTTTYTQARDNFAKLWDKVIEDQEPIIIERRGSESVALIAAAELSSLLETAHLLRSPKNAARLLTALERVRKGEGEGQTLESFRQEMGLEKPRRETKKR
jgi:antitoxin YefM